MLVVVTRTNGHVAWEGVAGRISGRPGGVRTTDIGGTDAALRDGPDRRRVKDGWANGLRVR